MRRGLPALLLTTLARAAAAEVETEFAPFLHDSDRPQVLALDGPIDGRTPVMFQRALQRFADVTVLELSSDGGNVYDALPLAYVVRRVGLRASIPPGRSCASACTYLFFAGVGRDAEGQLGVRIESADPAAAVTVRDATGAEMALRDSGATAATGASRRATAKARVAPTRANDTRKGKSARTRESRPASSMKASVQSARRLAP